MAGVRKREEANRTREAGNRDEVEVSQQDRSWSLHLGPLASSNWLDAALRTRIVAPKLAEAMESGAVSVLEMA